MLTYAARDGAVTVSVDEASLPEISRLALMTKGLAHWLGNEVASKVVAKADKFEEETKAPATIETKAGWRKDFTEEYLARLQSGEITVERGSSVDPVEREAESLAKADLQAVLRAKGSWPKGKIDDETVFTIGGNSRSWRSLIDAKLARDVFSVGPHKGKSIAEVASKNVAKRLADKAKVAAKVASDAAEVDLSDL